MIISLVSTPEYTDGVDTFRWLATESPNNFRLLRQDYGIIGQTNDTGNLAIEIDDNFAGAADDSIIVTDTAGNTYAGTVVTITDPTHLVTDIPYTLAAAASYFNDVTLYAGFYFEGRLTVNGVLYPLTIIASPDKDGFADLDVSGVLRIITSLGKTGNYTSRLMAETNKSGRFTLEYRPCWYGSDEGWIPAGGTPSVEYYYAECVRSEEQGSNLHEYVATDTQDAPFLNQFDQPVYFLGLPFDLSFILPEVATVSPTTDITVTLTIYSSLNVPLATVTETIAAGTLEGYVNSLNIDEATIPTGAAYILASIEV